jgi:magnesium transporter
MIHFHIPGEKSVLCTDLGHCHSLVQKAVWIDLFQPTEQEDIVMDAAFQIDIPTRPEMQEIEVSSRLYRQGEDLFMTATVLTNVDVGHPENTAVTFILSNSRLITVRHADPLPFRTFGASWDAESSQYGSGEKAFEGLMGAVVERIADILEQAGTNLDRLSHEIFRAGSTVKSSAALSREKGPRRDLEALLNRLGRTSDLISKVRESTVSLGRLMSFFRSSQKGAPPELIEHVDTLIRDLGPLSDHASFLSTKVNFLLDATLGLINIEQNAIIKIFTIAAVFFLPPTVVGTIYGMNFEAMPELKWALGYPFAIFLMLVSAIAPYIYFKRRGWF